MRLDLPPPRNWQDFEDLCRDLWAALWNDPDAQKHGRQGQLQAGVDVFGRQGGSWVGVQCKKEGRLAGSMLKIEDIVAAVERAATFEPRLSSLVIATTGPRDAEAQAAVRQITELGKLKVRIASWEDIVQDLIEHPQVLAKHYPQVAPASLSSIERARRHYLQTLWERCYPLHLTAISEPSSLRRDFPLVAVYTALDVTERIGLGTERTPGRNAPEALDEGGLIRDTAYRQALLDRIQGEVEDERKKRGHQGSDTEGYSRRLTALEAAAGVPRLVLVGPPGSGKSTFVRFLALSLAGEALGSREADLGALNGPDLEDRPWPHGPLLPVLVELWKFVASDAFPRSGKVGQVDDLLKYLESESPRVADSSLRELLQNSLLDDVPGTLMILDGLDQIPAAEMCRERLFQVIASLVERYPQCRVLLTCRPYAYEPESPWRLDEKGFQEAWLAPFDEIKIQAFIDGWYRHLADRWQIDRDLARQRGDRLWREILSMNYLQPLAERPLMLTLIADLHASSGGRLPGGRAGVYERSVSLLLDRWNESRGLLEEQTLAEHLGMSDHEIRYALEELAYEVHRDQGTANGNAGVISSRDLFQALDSRRRSTSECKVDERRVMDYLHQRSGIVLAESPSHFRFPHRSYQEYLAACYLTRTNFPALLLEKIREDPALWGEVLLLAVGKVAETPFVAWALLEGLVNELPKRSVPNHPGFLRALYAGLAIRENRLWQGIQDQDFSKLERIRLWLEVTLWEGALSPRERAEAGRVLSVLGDRRPGVGVTEEGVPEVDWVEIPAGRILMGSSTEDDGPWDDTPKFTFELPAYRISRYPVTNTQYRTFVNDGGYTDRWRRCWTEAGWAWKGKREGPDDDFPADDILDNHPRVNICWFEAHAFSRWLGERLGHEVRLPTEAEWERAARGTEGRTYPWGEQFDASRCNCLETGIGQTTAVGSFPDGASPDDVLDLIGNVWEWCSTKWRESYEEPRDDNPEGSASRLLCGGSYEWGAQTGNRLLGRPPMSNSRDIGFRVSLSYTANLFRPGILLPGDMSPPGRLGVITEIEKRLTQRGSCVVLGPRRSGKTSILRYLRSDLGHKRSVRFLDLQGHSCRNPDLLAKGLEPKLAEHPQPAAEFRRLLSTENKPIILLDELGRLRNADNEADPNVFEWLRSLAQDSVALVLAGTYNDWYSVQLRDAEKPGSSFSNIMKAFQIGPLSEDEALGFLEDTAPDDISIDPKTVGRWIFDLTGGWPFYLQVLGYAFVEGRRANWPDESPGQFHIRQLYTRALLREYEFVFRQRWQELPGRSQNLLLSAPRLPDQDSLSPSDIEHLERQGLFDQLHGWLIGEDKPFMDWIGLHRKRLAAESEG